MLQKLEYRIAWNNFSVTNEKKIAESLEKQSRKGKNISLNGTFNRSHKAYFVFCLQMNNTNLNSRAKGQKRHELLESQEKLPRQGRKQTPYIVQWNPVNKVTKLWAKQPSKLRPL